MKKIRLLLLLAGMLGIKANAQSLSVQNIEVQTGEDAVLVVSLAESTSMTALQFNLSLSEGVSHKDNSSTYGTTLSTATYKAPEVPDDIEGINADNNAESGIYTLDGKQVKTLQKGVNIIRKSDNTVKKVYVK